MSKSEFREMMELVKGAYGDRFQELTKKVLSVWYDCLSDLDGNRLLLAARKYIKNRQYPPTIADLRNEYRGMHAEEPEEGPFDRFRNLPEAAFEEYRRLGIIDDDGGIECGLATPEQIRILQESGAL